MTIEDNYIKMMARAAFLKTDADILKRKWRGNMAEWISVKDRLPEPMREVLVCNEENSCQVVAFMDTGDEWRHAQHLGKVTHWMPLPEPPKAKGWHVCMNAEEDEPTINIIIEVSNCNLPLTEFEDRVYRLVRRAMTGIKREWGDDG